MSQLNLQALLKALLDKGASDLHITAGSPPRLRIDNELVRLQTEPLGPVDTKTLCYSVMNDAPSTVSRMLNMGIEPFLVTASVNLVVAQRLARRICESCKGPGEKHPDALARMGMTEEQIRTANIMKGRGCQVCNNTGYKGRVALYEVMPFTDSLKELVLQGESAAGLKAEMIRGGTQSLRMAGLAKILEGMTTPEEILRTTVED